MKSMGSVCMLLLSERAAKLLGDRARDTASLCFSVAPAEELRFGGHGDGLILCEADGEELLDARADLQLMLVTASAPTAARREALAERGVMVCSAEQFTEALPGLEAACVHARLLRRRGENMERRLEDTRIVTRAKLLLMTRLGMTETQAHRYLEKSAMDTGAKLREAALRIIRIYEE